VSLLANSSDEYDFKHDLTGPQPQTQVMQCPMPIPFGEPKCGTVQKFCANQLEILTAHTLRGAKMRHRAKFCANQSRHCGDMSVFDFSRSWPSAILDFQKLEILTAHTLRKAKVRYHAKFCADQSNSCGDMAVFNFSRWRPSAILDLIYACLDYPPSLFWWSLSLCKIWFESVQ